MKLEDIQLLEQRYNNDEIDLYYGDEHKYQWRVMFLMAGNSRMKILVFNQPMASESTVLE